ncbi:MAG: adenosine deaminase family protein [Actinobacteria bacterium]|nr:adenosine deaminase family protein [Actinomycetota bacterium]
MKRKTTFGERWLGEIHQRGGVHIDVVEAGGHRLGNERLDGIHFGCGIDGVLLVVHLEMVALNEHGTAEALPQGRGQHHRDVLSGPLFRVRDFRASDLEDEGAGFEHVGRTEDCARGVVRQGADVHGRDSEPAAFARATRHVELVDGGGTHSHLLSDFPDHPAREVAFDIAGAEAGYPPTRHLDAFQYIQRSNFHTTIHAGEAFGLPSIWEALQFCGAERLGHGVRIVDDITGEPGSEVLGRLAEFVRDRRIPLELCPTSNVNTGVCKSIAEHPIGMLRRLRFRVTLNTDNRLMSNTSMTREFTQCADAFGWTLDDFQWVTVNSVKSAFAHFEERLKIINEIVKPRYAALRNN